MAQDNKKLKRKVRSSYAISTVSISLVLFLLGAVGYLTLNAFNATDRLKESMSVHVMLKDGITEQQRDSIGQRLRAIPDVKSAVFTSKDDAAKEFISHQGTDFVQFLGVNPLPDSYEVKISSNYSERNAAAELEKQISAWVGVEEVVYQRGIAEQITANVNKFNLILLLFGGALLFISIILLNNTIRVTVYSKRYIINTMKLVGADPRFIRKPFLKSSILQGIYAGLIASLMFIGMVAGLHQGLPEVNFMIKEAVLLIIIGAMFVSGILISVIFTTFAVNKFVRMPSSSVHAY